MKKLFAILLSALVVGCSAAVSQPQQTPTPSPEASPAPTQPIEIAALKGPTAMGLAALSGEEFSVNVYATADEITARLLKGELSAAAIPVNFAAVLNQKSQGKLKIAAVNTLGVLYLVEAGDTIKSIADLKGKTIYATGKGTVPEYTLRHILSQNGLDPDHDVTLEFKTAPDEVAALLAAGQAQVAMLPEPFVTVAKTKKDTLRTALSLSQEYEKLHGRPYVTGVLVVNEQLSSDSARMERLLQSYRQSSEAINATDVEQAAKQVAALGIVPEPVAKQAIKGCSLVLITGEEMKTLVNDYLNVLYDANEQSVGGKRPDETLYFN